MLSFLECVRWWWQFNHFGLPVIYCFSWKSDHKWGTRGHVREWESIHFHVWRKASGFTCCCCHLVVEGNTSHWAASFLLSDYFRFSDHTSGPERDRVKAPGHHPPGVKHPGAPRYVHGHGNASRNSGSLWISYLVSVSAPVNLKPILFWQNQHTSSLLVYLHIFPWFLLWFCST